MTLGITASQNVTYIKSPNLFRSMPSDTPWPPSDYQHFIKLNFTTTSNYMFETNLQLYNSLK